MSADNTAVQIDAGAYLSIPDPGADSEINCMIGDPLTTFQHRTRSGHHLRCPKPNRRQGRMDEADLRAN
ncbi:hypothetical protein SH528x_002012 [Novipirellula sp. SH528]|uniref:hypothetical protein n=1 Tax=Novipirellula sp. SH528 TaxID=3454466 RepID=UPI003FA0056A